MNLPSFHASRITPQVARPPRDQGGSAVIVVIALLAIILVYVAGNIRTLTHLGRELKLLERKQTQRLLTATWKTNSPPAISLSTNAVSPAGKN